MSLQGVCSTLILELLMDIVELLSSALQDDLLLPLGFFFLDGVTLVLHVHAGSETGQKSHLKEVKYLSGFIVPVGK